MHIRTPQMSCNSEPLSEGKMAPLLVSNTNHGTSFRLKSVLTSSCARNCIFFFKLLTIEVIHDIRPTSLSPFGLSHIAILASGTRYTPSRPRSLFKYLELIYFASLRKHKVEHRTSLGISAAIASPFFHPFDLSTARLYYDYGVDMYISRYGLICLTHTTFHFTLST